jgi:cathepsin A (carboxypeptidase C)
VHQGNAALAPGDIKINLAGVGIGNGLTVPAAQYPEYATLAYNFTKEKLGKPVITLATYETMVRELATCVPLIERCQTDTSVCAQAQSVCNNAQIGPYEATGLNPYDFRIPCEVPGLCYDESHVTAFMNAAATQKALGVEATWAACDYQVNGQFSSDWMKQFGTPNLQAQLDAGTKVLIYAGDVDFICNWLGNQAWALGLEWSGKAAFNAASMKPWSVDGAPAGLVRNSGAFTFLRVFDAGQ